MNDRIRSILEQAQTVAATHTWEPHGDMVSSSAGLHGVQSLRCTICNAKGHRTWTMEVAPNADGTALILERQFARPVTTHGECLPPHDPPPYSGTSFDAITTDELPIERRRTRTLSHWVVFIGYLVLVAVCLYWMWEAQQGNKITERNLWALVLFQQLLLCVDNKSLRWARRDGWKRTRAKDIGKS